MNQERGFGLLKTWIARNMGQHYLHNLQDDVLKDKWSTFQKQPSNAKLASLVNLRFGLNGGKPHILKDVSKRLGLPLSTACEQTKVAVRHLVGTPLPKPTKGVPVPVSVSELPDDGVPLTFERVFSHRVESIEARRVWDKLPNQAREQVYTVLLDLHEDARKRGEAASRRKLHEIAEGFWSAADGLAAALRLLGRDL